MDQSEPREASLWHELAANWRPLASSALALGCGASLFGQLFSIFVTPLEDSFGWTLAQISGSLSMLVVATLLYPFIGRMIDRKGVRAVAPVSAMMLAVGFVFASQASDALWTFYVAVLVLMAGGGATTALGYSRIIGDTFIHNRGFALAVMLSGAAITSMVFAPVVALVVDVYDWRAGFLLLAGIALFLGTPLSYLASGHAREQATENGEIVGGFELREVVRKRQFWILFAAIFFTGLPVIGISAHVSAPFEGRGLAATSAALMVSVLSMGVITGRFLTGFLIDRLWAPGVATFVLVLAAIGALTIAFSTTNVLLAGFGVLMLGMAQGAELDLIAFLAMRYFGMRAYSAIYGTLMISFAFALPFGATMFGILYDSRGDYFAALLIGAGLLVFAAFLFRLLGPYPALERTQSAHGQTAR
ncbi:MFS transporter [Erythrobacter sp. JGD-13]|uniref:MFS transporter n=2 Tax=Aurantiacibacter sediminis TaxID=2793064 RepID=A0ABS0N6I2_9SPHN|nr:MFS transporter [Aurantiacibacter sediminis]